MHAEALGKYKFILQSFAVVGLLVHYVYWGVDFYTAGIYFLTLAAVLALWSGVNYHVQFFRLRQSRVSAHS
jgi:phosphatidylglycerophosphate synthase